MGPPSARPPGGTAAADDPAPEPCTQVDWAAERAGLHAAVQKQMHDLMAGQAHGALVRRALLAALPGFAAFFGRRCAAARAGPPGMDRGLTGWQSIVWHSNGLTLSPIWTDCLDD